jgi:RHS repeat-associated protein
MEREDEIAGLGNNLNFGAREYDSRIARWFSGDPYEDFYPGNSTYGFALNNPVMLTDPSGELVQDGEGNIIVLELDEDSWKLPGDVSRTLLFMDNYKNALKFASQTGSQNPVDWDFIDGEVSKK